MALAWLLWVTAIAACDIYRRRVPNWLVLSGTAVAAAALCMNAMPFGTGSADAVLGAITGFGFLLVFYATGLMGAGDVKFAGALGLWVGLQQLAPIWVGASLIAGVHAVLWLMLQRWPFFPRLALALSGVPIHSNDNSDTPKRQRHIPFAAYLAITSVGWLVWRGPGL